MGGANSISLEAILDSGCVTEDNVLRLRHAFFQDGDISRHEAETLFDINRSCTEQDDGWPQFFIEALTDFIVHQEQPQGYVTVENADWLIARVFEDGHVETRTELELVIKVLDEARWSPDRLVKFALDQVKIAVVSGAGPLRSGSELSPGVIGGAEVEILRHILYASSGDGNIAVTRAEAEVLFDINDATSEAENDPSWSDLFVKAVANHLMAACGYRVPPREEALRLERWVEERDGTLGFMQKMVSGGLSAIWNVYQKQSAEERALERLEAQKREIIIAEALTEPEADWLSERIGRDGTLHENEKALLAFLRDESPDLHPSLEPLMKQLAA